MLCSAVCQRIPGQAGIACVPFPSVSAAAVGSQLERPIPTGSASPAGIAGGVREEQFLCSEETAVTSWPQAGLPAVGRGNWEITALNWLWFFRHQGCSVLSALLSFSLMPCSPPQLCRPRSRPLNWCLSHRHPPASQYSGVHSKQPWCWQPPWCLPQVLC